MALDIFSLNYVSVVVCVYFLRYFILGKLFLCNSATWISCIFISLLQLYSVQILWIQELAKVFYSCFSSTDSILYPFCVTEIKCHIKYFKWDSDSHAMYDISCTNACNRSIGRCSIGSIKIKYYP